MRARALLILAMLAALLSPMLGVGTAQATGDDYPYRTATTNSADAWGFTKRQCVSFAAWRLRQHSYAISNANNAWGNAYNWDTAATKRGFIVTSKPKVGTIAQWNANEKSRYYAPNGGIGTFSAGGYGHVGYVTTVYSDGSVRVEQYNMTGSGSYSAMRVKAPRFLYVHA